MPTILRIGSFRFFFYSGDADEPPHVHVERGEKKAKLWLNPVRLQSSGDFTRKEIIEILKLVQSHRNRLLRSWNEFFSA